MDTEVKVILSELEPLFKKAEEEKLWFYSTYQQLWFTPKELKEHQAQGRYIWSSINWCLRSPFEKLEELERKKIVIQQEIDEVRKRILTN